LFPEGACIDPRGIIIGFPIASKEFAQTRVVWLAGLSLRVLQVLCKPETEHLEHAVHRFIGSSYRNESVWRIEIVPVLEIGSWFEELGWERESNGSEIGNTNKPVVEKDEPANPLIIKQPDTYFLRIETKVLSFDPSLACSSGAFGSAGAAGAAGAEENQDDMFPSSANLDTC